MKNYHSYSKLRFVVAKFLRVWVKSPLRFDIFEKILKLAYKNLNGKLIFYPFSLPSSRTCVILCTSETPKFWGCFGGQFRRYWGVADRFLESDLCNFMCNFTNRSITVWLKFEKAIFEFDVFLVTLWLERTRAEKRFAIGVKVYTVLSKHNSIYIRSKTSRKINRFPKRSSKILIVCILNS